MMEQGSRRAARRQDLGLRVGTKEHFDNLRKKGFLAFKVGFLGFRGKVTSEFNAETGALLFTAPQESVKPEMVTEFDPKENYVVTPQIVGG